ncbi:biotin synthase BioB [Pseudobutyrivibrio ruminis]|uniref:Biotin synthase n=1 Tax=Pseudobutyrivibrio ruminis TaxID=46206 RepID=A0A2G3E0H7_9FIRM|nr:biotin synthase BioB [Pseudobutyrivibrio ruminis]PHU36650.1 biotin synthase BioB [Pseudobutyrivibrio ruminis]
MGNLIQELKEKVLAGNEVSKEEALALYNLPEEDLKELCQAADELREHFCNNAFDMCTIINGKSGRCSENCKFCSQSAHYKTCSEQYPLLDKEEIVKQAKYNADRGVLRYSIVTSGRALTDAEVDKVCEAVREIKRTIDIALCGSFGLLSTEQYKRLKEAGITRIHNNLETSESYFPNVCTTHTHEDKLQAIKNAREAGMSICSGGIMGLGESVEDRIDMAIELRGLNVKSVPVNMLNPIPGTPFEKNEKLTIDDMCRIVAVYRFILPDASIRLAGGRGLLPGHGRECFMSGANAVISGDMLTTAGYTIESDMNMIHELGYKEELWEK